MMNLLSIWPESSPVGKAPATVDPLLLALGYPENDHGQPALAALHAGVAFHRVAMISDVAAAYGREANLPADELAYRHLLLRPLAGEPALATAKRLYRAALRINAGFAEAWFNLARLLQASADHNGALVAFGQAAALPPHPRAQAIAQLHANAHWHMATLLEEAGRDDEALLHYNEALSRCDNFGVHHVRVAHFMRRRGLLTESLRHFERLMDYSHRYFTEFLLPPLVPVVPAKSPVSENIDVLYETSDGFGVVFWSNSYYRLPKDLLPVTAATLERMIQPDGVFARQKKNSSRILRRLFGRAYEYQGASVGKANSMADFELSEPITKAV